MREGSRPGMGKKPSKVIFQARYQSQPDSSGEL